MIGSGSGFSKRPHPDPTKLYLVTQLFFIKKQINSILQITRRKAFFVRNWRLELELEYIYFVCTVHCTVKVTSYINFWSRWKMGKRGQPWDRVMRPCFHLGPCLVKSNKENMKNEKLLKPFDRSSLVMPTAESIKLPFFQIPIHNSHYLIKWCYLLILLIYKTVPTLLWLKKSRQSKFCLIFYH